MTTSRRSFLQSGSLALGGVLFSGTDASAATHLKPSLTANDHKVIEFLRSFSNRILLVGGCVAAKINGKHDACDLIAEVTNLDHLADCLQGEAGHHLGEFQAVGNTLTFKKGDTEFTVETLVPEEFSARLRNLMLSAAGNLDCPHEALHFDPDSGSVEDPFSVLSETPVSQLVRVPYTRIVKKVRRMRNGRRRVQRIRKRAYRLVKKEMPGVEAELRLFPANQSPEEAFSALTNALVDKVRFGLSPDDSFEIDKKQILDPGSSLNQEQANAICREFTRAVSSLGGDRKAIRELLESRLLSDCLAAALGIDAADILKNFDRLRSTSSKSYTDGTIWTTLLLFDEIQRGKAFPWIAQADNLRLLKSQADLKEAALAFLR